MQQRLWSARDVAARIGTSRRWVYRAVRGGRLPWIDLEGVMRFDPDAIEAWLAARRRGPHRHTPWGPER